MTIASGMPTPFMSFETTDSQEFEIHGLPGDLFHSDGVGTARARLVSWAGSDLATQRIA